MKKVTSIIKAVIRDHDLLFALGTIGLLAAGYVFFIYDNRYFNFSVFLGLIFSPYIFRRVSSEKSWRLLWAVLPLGVLLCFRHSSSLFYFFCGFSVLYILESYWGRLNNLPFYLLALISSLAGHMAYVWSFPIRLQLSSWAANVLSLAGWKAVASGNIIVLDGQEFSVDPACMGLRMLITAGILGLLVLAHFERKYRHTFSFFKTGFYLALVLLLAILANFTRLLALVVFQILPGSPAHDAMGLLSLLVYVLVPFYLYLAYGLNWNKIQEESLDISARAAIPEQWVRLSYVGIILLLLFNGPKFRLPVIVQDAALSTMTLPGFQSTMVDGGILKLENEKVLIYIKPPVKPLQGTHDPRICWQGTGYDFTHIQKQFIGGEYIYTARLEKDGESLYTAWWLESGRERTTAEWRWRWSTLTNGDPFRLVNLTTLREEDLEREVLAFWELNR